MSNPIQIMGTDGSTRIIDGVSDVFRIAATGTIVVPSFTGPGTSTNSVTLSLGLTYQPAWLGFVQNAVSRALPYYVVDFSNGTVVDGYDMWVDVVGGDQTQITVATSTKVAGSFPGFTYRYYILQQAAF